MKSQLMFVLFLLAAVIALPPASGGEPAVTPLPQAHAHNDYLHDRPLLDALDQGFCSVEADVFLVDGKLLVAHTRSELKPDRTLESLYLKPLAERVRAGGGRVYWNGPQITLLIDFKNDGAETWAVLNEMLARYAEMLTRVEGDKVVEGAVTVIVSGDRPFEAIAKTSPRYAGVDGRLSDLDSDAPPHFMPLISDQWSRHFKWKGKGAMPEEERVKLAEMVRRAHQSGRRIRFWATPDVEPMWRTLREAGVDLINTDDLDGLSRFLRSGR